jgi:hypothetical protein
MKRINLFLLIFIFSSSFLFVHAQEEGEEKIKPPPGMEIRKVGNFNLMIPEGAEVRQKGNLLIVESTAEYAARKFLEVEQRLAQIEKKEEKLDKEVEELKKILNEIKTAEQEAAE